MLKKYIKIVKNLGVIVLASFILATTPVSVLAMPNILAFNEVVEGMRGVAYTVVDSSGEIITFPVEIIGRIEGGRGADRMIMARTAGDTIEAIGGVLQGMSGSPIYIDGKLIGALSAGIANLSPYTFFITPIEDMTSLWQLPDNKNKTKLPLVDIKKAAIQREKEISEREDAELAKEYDRLSDSEREIKWQGALAALKEDRVFEYEASEKKQREAEADRRAGEYKERKNVQNEQIVEQNSEEKAKVNDAGQNEANANETGCNEAALPTPSIDNSDNVYNDQNESNSRQDNTSDNDDNTCENSIAKIASFDQDSDKYSYEGNYLRSVNTDNDSKSYDNGGIVAKSVLYTGGFTPSGLKMLSEGLSKALGKSVELLPLAGNSSANKELIYDAELEGGSPVGVSLVYGDFNIGATGTVTAVDGKNIVAFGHSFMHRGNVNYFMTSAEVIGTIAGQSNGIKVANSGSIIGRVSQDRAAGIAGTLGEFPSTIPLRIIIKDKRRGVEESFSAHIAYDEDLIALLVGGIAYSAFNKVSDTVGAGTAKIHFAIRTKAVSEKVFERSNMYYSQADVGQILITELVQAMNILATGTTKEEDIVDVNVDIELDDARSTAVILSATPDKTTVKAGDTVNFLTRIKPYRRPEETLNIKYQVPPHQLPGTLNLDVRGGGLMPVSPLMLLEQAGLVPIGGEEPERTTADKLRELEGMGQNNEIIIAPGISPVSLSEKEQKRLIKMAKKYSKRQSEKDAAGGEKIVLLAPENGKEQKKERNIAPYIIENIIQVALKVEAD